jgi:hypothetical protein
MPKLVADYLASARQFERLALVEKRPEARQLLKEQAEICYRLAAKGARKANAPLPFIHIPLP